MKTHSVVFFGTHSFAARILQALIDAHSFTIQQVITQPDKPVGRSKTLTPPSVKVLAAKHNIPVKQPASLKSFTLENPPELSVVAQYGNLIPKHILDTPSHGTINVHTSLLPKYRGASPIQHALLNDDTVTGVTVMLMDEGLDTGPILTQQSTPIQPNQTYPELELQLAEIASDLLLETLPSYLEGDITPQPQNDALATHCSKLDRADGKLDFTLHTADLYNRFRAFTPWPGVWTTWEGRRIKFHSLTPDTKKVEARSAAIDNGILYIGTGDASLRILSLQMEGKKAMDASDFIAGHPQIHNAQLDT